jgi:hypothetical protein
MKNWMRTQPDLNPAPLIIDLTAARLAPVLLRWPADEERRLLLAERGVPRLFLVDGGSVPPVCTDPLEDWIRVPCEERDLEARMAALQARTSAATPAARPRLDGNRRLLRGDRWVPLSPIEERLCRLLLSEFGAVVSDRRLMASAWPTGSATSTGLRLQVTRLRRRIADLDLEIRSVRGKGYVLQNGSTSGAAPR